MLNQPMNEWLYFHAHLCKITKHLHPNCVCNALLCKIICKKGQRVYQVKRNLIIFVYPSHFSSPYFLVAIQDSVQIAILYCYKYL